MADFEFAEQQRKKTEEIVRETFCDYDAFVQCNLIIRDRCIMLQTIVGVKPEGETRDITIIAVAAIPPSEFEMFLIGRKIMRQYLSDIS